MSVKSIEVGAAFDLVKRQLGQMLSDRGVTDADVKEYLKDMAEADYGRYMMMEPSAESTYLADLSHCLNLSFQLSTQHFNCIIVRVPAASTDEERTRIFGYCDQEYGVDKWNECMAQAQEGREALEKSALALVGGSRDKNTITPYDVNSVPYYSGILHLNTFSNGGTLEAAIRKVLKEYLEPPEPPVTEQAR